MTYPSHELASSDSNMQLHLPATANETILRKLNDLHLQMFNVDRRMTAKPNDGGIPGVPTGRHAQHGVKGEILDVIEELVKLVDRQEELLDARGD